MVTSRLKSAVWAGFLPRSKSEAGDELEERLPFYLALRPGNNNGLKRTNKKGSKEGDAAEFCTGENRQGSEFP